VTAELVSVDLDAPRILLVEDDPADARRLLELVELASSGRARLRVATRLAVARSELIERGADCVLLDLDLPDSHGLDTVGGIALAAPWAPIVVLSDPADEALARTTLQLGAQDHLVKGVADGAGVMRSVRYAMERKRVENELAHQALHDPLTGLPNRVLFGERLAGALARCQEQPGFVAVILLDLDRFKMVNDGLGHDAGDELLIEVARRLEETLRSRDSVARLGGDEFLVLCEVASELEVFEVAERVQHALVPAIVVAGTEVVVTATAGIAATSDSGVTAGTLLRDADIAMHRAKRAGTARVEVFDTEMHRRVTERLHLEQDLRRGVADGELVAHFQPVVDLTSGAAVGAEALVRWQHPSGELRGPGAFIEVAEETGLIVPMGRQVLEHACSRAAVWGATRRPYPTTMSVNLSARQLADGDLVGEVQDALDRHGVEPARMWFEITEQAIIVDEPVSLATLHSLRSLGVRLCLDDFGTGYSSLTHLTQFPLDGVKIDRSFVAGLGVSDADRAIVRAVIALAQELDLTVVAEGIETREQADELHALGCGLAQGYAFGRPGVAEDLPDVA
jgi:diguanylate cyclase (GGDEF)-like protein